MFSNPTKVVIYLHPDFTAIKISRAIANCCLDNSLTINKLNYVNFLPGIPLHSIDIWPPWHTRPETLTSPSTGVIHYSIAMHVKKL